MDTFIEQIVQQKKTALDYLLIGGCWLLAVVLTVICWLFVPPFALFVLCGSGFVAWWLSTARNKEYEYCVTNGDVDIDLITAKRARKRVVSVAGRKIETLLPYDTAKSTAGYQRVVVAAPSLREAGLWSFTYHSKKNGHTLVVFQPEQRVLSALYQGLPKLVQMDTDRAARGMGLDLFARRHYGE